LQPTVAIKFVRMVNSSLSRGRVLDCSFSTIELQS